MEMDRTSPRLIAHGGGGTGYTAFLWLAPERGIGVFVACNANDDALQTAVTDALTTHLFGPESRELPAASGSEPASPEPWTGTYRHVRHAQTTPEKLLALTMHADVTATDTGLVATGFGSGPTALRSLGDGQYARPDGSLVVFDRRAGTTYLFVDDTGAPAYERISAWETLPVQGTVLSVLALIFLLAVAGGGWAWRRGTAPGVSGAAALVGGTYLLFLAGFAVVVGWTDAGFVFFTGPTLALRVVLLLPFVALGATAYLAVRMVSAWRAGGGSTWVWGGGGAVLAASGVGVVVLETWNLVGWWF
jgi:hypothetical protein